MRLAFVLAKVQDLFFRKSLEGEYYVPQNFQTIFHSWHSLQIFAAAPGANDDHLSVCIPYNLSEHLDSHCTGRILEWKSLEPAVAGLDGVETYHLLQSIRGGDVGR